MVAKVGLPVPTKVGQKYLLNTLLTSCATNLPELDDQLGMKRGSQTFILCPTSFPNLKDFPCSESPDYGTLRHLKGAQNSVKKIGNINKAESISGHRVCIQFSPFQILVHSFPFFDAFSYIKGFDLNPCRVFQSKTV